MDSPYWTAVRSGKAEYWYRSSGAFITIFRYQDQLYRSDCRRRTSDKMLRKQGWILGKECRAQSHAHLSGTIHSTDVMPPPRPLDSQDRKANQKSGGTHGLISMTGRV